MEEKKLVKKILALVLIVTVFMADIPAFAFNNANLEEDRTEPIEATQTMEAFTDTGTEEAHVVSEVLEKRESNIKHFRMSNGSLTAAVYPYDVHYEDEEGKLQDIDNRLDLENDGSDDVLSNKKNSTFVKFMKKSNANKLYTLNKDGYKIMVSIEGISKVSAITENSESKKNTGNPYVLDNLSSQVTYEDILKNTDIQYKLVGPQLKENIIIKEKTDFDSLIYNYHLNGSLEAVQQDDKNIALYEKDGDNEVLHISAPVLWDASGNYYDQLKIEILEQKNSKITVRLSWELQDDITYPITIDPVMSFSTNRNNIQDTHIIKGYPTTNYDYNNHLRVRNDGYSMLKFPLPTMNSGDKIVNAQLVLAPYGAFDNSLSIYSNENSYNPPLYITTHKILRSWEETTATYQSVNPENGFYDDTVYSYRVVDGDDSYYTWDITRLASEWTDGGATNYGVLLKYDESPSDGSVFDSFFCSTNGAFTDSSAWPQILFQYINTTGIEDYYSYHTQDLGYAGTGYTNDLTGNLTIINPILQVGGSLMPITVSLVYNTNNVNVTQAPYGTGWKLNWHQRIDWSVKSNYDSTQYVKYEDGDGTNHFFTIDSTTGIWTDEINPDRKIYFISSTGDYKMTDSSGVCMYFKRNGTLNEWYLYKVVDEYGNYIQLDLNANSMKRVEKIYSSTGSVVELEYSVYGFLTKVIYYDEGVAKSIQIKYNGYVENHNNGLSDVIYADGSGVQYHYFNNTKYLSKVFDITGCNTVYNYHWNGKMRIDTITTYDSSSPSVRGDRLVIDYEGTATTITDEVNNRKYLYTFAQNGTLKSVVDITDNDGNGYGQYYEYNNNDTSTSAGKGNLTFISKTQKSTVNLLKNHSFEGTTALPTFQVWNETEGTSSGQVTTEKKNMGSKAYRLYRHEQSNSTRVLAYYTKTLEAGETYTLSAYVNTSEMKSKGKGASLYVRNGSFNAESEYITNSKNEWQRIFLTFTVPATGTVSICLSLCGATGAVYFDNVQLETGELSDYNLLENAGFEEDTSSTPRGWVSSNNKGSISETHKIAGKRALYIPGTITKHLHYYQVLTMPNGKSGDSYIMSAFSKGYSVSPIGYKYTLMIRFLKNGSIVDEHKEFFNHHTNEWQKVSGVAKAKADYDTIQFWLLYYNNVNRTYFDNAQLVKDTFGTSYTYDGNGNLVSTVDLQGKEEYTFKYNGNNQLIQEKSISGGKILYSYNSSKKQQLDAVTVGGVSTHYSYDTKGNATSTTTMGSELVDGKSYYIQSVYYSKYLNVTNSGTTSGTSVGLADFNKNSAQRWKLIRNTDGSYSLSPECADNKLLSVNSSSLGNSVNFALYSSGEKTYQRFKFVKRYGNIYCLDIAENTNYAIDCNGTNIYTYKMHHGEVQQFALIPVSDNNSNTNPSIISSATYTANGEYAESITDSRGNTTNYEYNVDRGYLKSQTNPNEVKTSYSYYDNELLKSVSLPNGTNTPMVIYSYDDYKRLDTITSPSGTVYGFVYDSFGRNDTIKLGGLTLSQYLYDSKGRLDTFIYGNGNTVKYGYDYLNRQTSIIINDALRYNKQYDGHSRLLQIEDILLGKKIKYEYDILNRAVSEKLVNAETNTIYAQLNIRYDDSKNRVAGYDVNIEGMDEATDYVYGENQVSPDMITSVKYNGTKKLSYDYDGLNRLVTRTLGTDTAFATEYTYIAGKGKDDVEDNTGLTTNLVKTLKNGSDIYEYTYDKLGNITQIKKNDIVIESYAYDNLNQLIAVVKGEDIYAYTYDAGGNILSVSKNGVVEDTYTYDNAEWKDLLTVYNGQTITYDVIGNPLTYRDEMSFTWSDGRKLATITRGTDSISYTYDANGLRNSKTVNGTTTDFYWLSGTLYGQKTGIESMYFLYDENGTAYGFILDKDEEKSQYYYEFNVQGDIIGVIDSTGTRVVEYIYDAWGNILSITGTLADTVGQQNPLRYRGYYYDAETGFYYVSSRYYDPEVGRFINADGEISNVGEDILGYNMFAYCMNNPVNMEDSTGNWPKWVKKAVAAVAVVAVVAVVAAVTVATAGMGSTIACVAIGAAQGAAIGLAVGAVTGAATGAITNRVKTGSWKGTGQAILDGAADGALSGAISGAITGGISNGINNVCFVAGTSILTSMGYVAIENIIAGDKVWSENPETGEKELKEVVQTFVNKTDELVHVYVNGEEIITTPEHPFCVPIKGWISAINLRAGDILVLQSGKYVVVELVQHEILESPITVYNFEVEDFHTYYVGDSAVLVHNTCGIKNTPDQNALIQLVKENRKGISMDDAKILVEWAKEYNIPGNPRIDMGHLRGNIISRNPHLHINPVNHIPIWPK